LALPQPEQRKNSAPKDAETDAWTELELDSVSSDVLELVEDGNAVSGERSLRRPRTQRDEANAAMERYASGDDSAFTDLYDLLTPRLHAYLLRQTRDAARAEDLLQQTMLQLHSTRGRFMMGGEVFAWAFAIARRLLINSYRRRQREVRGREVQLAETPAFPAPADEVLHSKRLSRTVERELSRLPERQRVAIELMKKDGLSLREVAEVLGTTSNAVKLRVHRACATLRAALIKRVDAGEG